MLRGASSVALESVWITRERGRGGYCASSMQTVSICLFVQFLPGAGADCHIQVPAHALLFSLAEPWRNIMSVLRVGRLLLLPTALLLGSAFAITRSSAQEGAPTPSPTPIPLPSPAPWPGEPGDLPPGSGAAGRSGTAGATGSAGAPGGFAGAPGTAGGTGIHSPSIGGTMGGGERPSY